MDSNNTYTLSIFTENSPGVLHRITTMFTKRKINIDSLTVSETEQHGISRFTFVVKVDDRLIDTLVKQLKRIIEVHDAFASRNDDLIFGEIAFIRIFTDSDDERAKVEEKANRYDAEVIYAGEDSIVVQKTGSYAQIQTLYKLLQTHGTAEFISSGRIAIRKDAKPRRYKLNGI